MAKTMTKNSDRVRKLPKGMRPYRARPPKRICKPFHPVREEAVGANGVTVAQALADFRRNIHKPEVRREAMDVFTTGVQHLRDVNYLLAVLNRNYEDAPGQKHLVKIAESYTTLTVGLAKLLWPLQKVK